MNRNDKINLDRRDEPIEALSALRNVDPPADLVARVMNEVEAPAPFSLRNWLLRRRRLEVTFTPAGAVVSSVLALVAVVTFFAVSPRSVPEQARIEAKAEPTAAGVLVRFILTAAGAHSVTVAGDFNGWDPAATPLAPGTDGTTFAATLPLARGDYQYMFVVDGEWIADPSAGEQRADGYGSNNSVLRL